MSPYLSILLLAAPLWRAQEPPASEFTELAIFSRIWTPGRARQFGGQSVPQLGKGLHIDALALSSDGSRLAGGDADGALTLWDPASGRRIATLKGGGKYPHRLAFVDRDRALLASSWEGSVRLWDLQSVSERRVFDGVTRFAVGSRGTRAILWAPKVSRLQVLDLDSSTVIREWAWPGEPIQGMDLSPEGRFLAVAGQSPPHVGMLDLESGDRTFRLAGDGPGLLKNSLVKFSPDGALLLWSLRDRTLHLCDATTGHEIATIRKAADLIPQVDFSPDGRLLGFAGGTDSDFHVMDWKTLGSVAHFTLRSGSGTLVALFSPDGKKVFGGGNECGVLMLDLNGAEEGRPPALRPDETVPSLWTDLAADEPGSSVRAMHALAELGNASVQFLRARILEARPLENPEKLLPRLLADLDADEPERRSTAFRDLVRLGREAEPALRTLLAASPSAEVQAVIPRILKAIAAPAVAPEQAHARLHRALYAIESSRATMAAESLKELSTSGEDCVKRHAAAAARRLGRP
jgi:WD40 repeat protein